jgi:hypothetical protein
MGLRRGCGVGYRGCGGCGGGAEGARRGRLEDEGRRHYGENAEVDGREDTIGEEGASERARERESESESESESERERERDREREAGRTLSAR